MLTHRYLSSVKNLSTIMDKIVSGTAPEHFTNEHLKNIGFRSSNDRAIIPLLKDLGFLTPDGVPTQRYHEYRNSARSRKVLGEALKEAYSDVFHINAKPTKSRDREDIQGLFKSTHNVSDRVAEQQALTFFTLLDLADLSDSTPPNVSEPTFDLPIGIKEDSTSLQKESSPIQTLSLRYNIEIHLPATKDIEVFNAIFKSIKENLVD